MTAPQLAPLPAARPLRGIAFLGVAMLAALSLVLVACEDATEAPTGAAPTDQAVASPAPTPQTYVVRRGETLANIAIRTGVPLERLVELNNIADPDVIEVGQVLLLEPAPTPGTALATEAPPEEADDPLLDWAREQWERLPRPDLEFTDNAMSQGAMAGLMLPAAVIAFVVLWLLALGARGLLRRLAGAAARGVRAGLRGSGARPAVTAAAGAAPAGHASASGSTMAAMAATAPTRGGSSGAAPALTDPPPVATEQVATPAAKRLPSLAPAGGVLLAAPRAAGRAAGRGGASVLGAARRSGARAGRWLMAVPRGAAAQFARDRQRQRAERQRVQARERWWKHGTETLRIGLLDEAERLFRSGLLEAERHGWSDEQRLYADGLLQVEERRRGERVALMAQASRPEVASVPTPTSSQPAADGTSEATPED